MFIYFSSLPWQQSSRLTGTCTHLRLNRRGPMTLSSLTSVADVVHVHVFILLLLFSRFSLLLSLHFLVHLRSRVKMVVILWSGQMALQPAANENILGQRDSSLTNNTWQWRLSSRCSIPGKYVWNLTIIHHIVNKLVGYSYKNNHYLSIAAEEIFYVLWEILYLLSPAWAPEIKDYI